MSGSTRIGKTTLFALLVTLGCTSLQLTAASASADEIKWHSNYAQALQEAKQKDRPLLVQFSARWCGYCTQMRQQTLSDKEVIREVNERFVALKLDADRDRELVGRFGVRSYPTTIVVSPERKILHRSPGFQGVGQLLSNLRSALKTKER